jgi:hypothetical protein
MRERVKQRCQQDSTANQTRSRRCETENEQAVQSDLRSSKQRLADSFWP